MKPAILRGWPFGEISEALKRRGIGEATVLAVKPHRPGWVEFLLILPGVSREVTVVVPERRPEEEADLSRLRMGLDTQRAVVDIKSTGERVLTALDKL